MLPAGLAALLALAAGLQLALAGGETELPEPGWLGGGARTSLPQFGIGGIPAPLREVTMFDPARSAAAGSGAAPVTPLGGAAVAGSISVRGRTFAIVQRPDGSVGRVPIGGTVGGLRLIGLGQSGAVFQQGGKRLTIPYGTSSISPVSAGGGSEEESE